MPVPLLTCSPADMATRAFCCVIVLSTLAPAPSSAQISPAQRDALLQLSEAARSSIDVQRFPAVDPVRADLLAAVENLDAYLTPRTSEKNRADWLKYVDADPLVDALRDGASAEEITKLAQELRGRLIGDIRGLELAAMRRLRGAAERLAATARFENPDAAAQLVDQQLQALTRRLEAMDGSVSTEDAAALSTILGMLQPSNQAPELVAATRAAFSRPNLVAWVDGRVIEQAIAREVNQTRPVRDCILGTTVIGTGTLTGSVVGRLAPSHGSVQVDLILTGQFNSNTVGYNGPVRLPTVGHGQVTASRTIWINEQGPRLSPTMASAELNSRITSIQHPLRIVRHIARKQIARKQPQAERIATGRLQSQVAGDFDQQTSQAVSGGAGGTGPMAALLGGGEYSDSVDPIKEAKILFARLNLPPPARTVGSTPQNVYAQVTQRDATQLAADTSPPPLSELVAAVRPSVAGRLLKAVGASAEGESSDALYDGAIQLHESFVDNIAARVLGGRTVSGEQIDQLLASSDKPLLDLVSEEAEPEPFEIDFSTFRPVILELRDQTVRIGIRGTRFSQGARELARPLEITATYEPQRTALGTMLLQRRGDVSVDFPGGRRLTIQQVALRRTIQRLFADRFPETLLERPLIIPDFNESAALEVRTLRTRLIDARDGWLSIAVKFSNTPLTELSLSDLTGG